MCEIGAWRVAPACLVAAKAGAVFWVQRHHTDTHEPPAAMVLFAPRRSMPASITVRGVIASTETQTYARVLLGAAIDVGWHPVSFM